MFQPSSFYSVLTPMFYTTKCFGLTPFKIDSENCENSKINLLWSVSFALFITAYGCTGIGGTSITYELIATVTRILDTYFSQTGMCCGILFGCIYRNDIISILHDMKSFDKYMQNNLHINLKKEYRKSKIYSLLGLISTSTCAVIFLMSTTFGTASIHFFTYKLFGTYINSTVPYLINTFVDLQFCTLLLNLKQRFRWLNTKLVAVSKNLENNLKTCNDGLILTTNRVRPVTHVVATGFAQDRAIKFLETIRSYHYLLCTISNRLNKAYSVQILLIVLQDVITIIASLYYSGKYILVDNIVPVDYLLYSGVQLTVAIGQLMAIVISCSLTASEAHQAGIIIHKITLLHKKLKNGCKEELRVEMTYFSLQLLHHNVKFSACKFFVINEELIFSIIGAITTYLVIVLQFEINNIQQQPHDSELN